MFDLSNAPNNIRKAGYLATDVLNDQVTFIMAEKGMIFTAPVSMPYWTTFTKKFFNISSPIVNSTVSMSPNASSNCHAATYYVPPQSTYIFIIEASP